MTGQALAIESVPGIGAQLAARIRTHFRCDEAFFDALRRQDVTAISRVPGLAGKRAVRLVQEASGGAGVAQVMPTDAAQRLHQSIVERIQSFCATAAARDRVALLGPLRDPEEAQRAQEAVLAWRDRVSGWDRQALRHALARIRPSVPAPPRRDVGLLVVADDDARARLERAGADRWAEVAGPEAAQTAGDYRVVVNLHPDLDLDLPQCTTLAASAPPHEAVPDMTLAWFEQHRKVLEALAEVARLTGAPSAAPAALAAMDGQAAPAPVRLDTLAAEALEWANQQLRQRVADIRLTGTDLLEAAGRMPAPMRKAVDGVLREANAMVQKGGSPVPLLVADAPIAIDEEALWEAQQQAAARAALQHHESRRRAAIALAKAKGDLEAEIEAALELDHDVALGCFALDRGLGPSRFGGHLEFSDGLHLDLARDGFGQGVAYHLRDHHVAVLTGANSGGKTTLLELVAQVVWMARLGLPVPAGHATVPWVDEIHYVTTRRALDAGAFEAFLRRFLPIAAPGRRRLVLADEVEAMTELGAAAAILRFFLGRLVEGGHFGVLVTHLATQVGAAEVPGVRVDGIQARGLDEAGQLIVDRTPRMGCAAASTPELIVERLARTSRGPDQALWLELLDCVRQRGAPQGSRHADPAPLM